MPAPARALFAATTAAVLLLGASPASAGPVAAAGAAVPAGGGGAPASSTKVVALIDAGSTASYRDSEGRLWQADAWATGGRTTGNAQRRGPVGATDPGLLRTMRYGSDFSYAVPVPAQGTYLVTLTSVELAFKRSGVRSFGVRAEGRKVASRLDLAASPGPRRVWTKEVRVAVTDGVLDLRFTASRDNAQVSSIAVRQVVSGSPTSSPTAPTPSGAPTPSPNSSSSSPSSGAPSSATPVPAASPSSTSGPALTPAAVPVPAAPSSSSTPSTSPSSTRPPSGSGVQPPQDGYSLVWGDEFDGTSVDARRWNVRNNSWANNEESIVTSRPQNVFVRDGVLTIRSQRERYTAYSTTRDFTSGYLDTINKQSWTYGRFSMRAQLPTQPGTSRGLWPAFWLRPDDGGIGELDIMEAVGSGEGGSEWTMTHQTVHRDYTGAVRHQAKGSVSPVGIPSDGFHTYTVDWEPGKITWYVDGVQVWVRDRATTPWIDEAFGRPFNIRLNQQVGGTWAGTPDAATAFPADFKVDWVRVYQR